MLDRAFIRGNLSAVGEKLKGKNFQFNRRDFVSLDEEERSARRQWEKLRALRNRTSEEIALLKEEGRDVAHKVQEMKEVGAHIKRLDEELLRLEAQLKDFLAVIPSLPHSSVPIGSDKHSNAVVRKVGTPRRFNFPPRDHVDLGVGLGILDLDRATKIAGARFANYYGSGALLERALVNLMLDTHTREHGYQEILPPFVANRPSFFGTGNLPKFEADLFHLEGTDYYLVPTAEVPVTNIFANEILPEGSLPISLVAHTPCFRSEAGSYGRDTRGLIRQHQFNKVELVKFTRPDDSYEHLERLTKNAEEILRRLELPYRVVTLSTGDMGFSSAKTYDLEVWVPSQNMYREISSCSNFEDFQARRANIRYRPQGEKRTLFIHTLNGSALAVGRTWVAVIENCQQEDGSVTIPSILRPYMHGAKKLVRERGVGSV